MFALKLRPRAYRVRMDLRVNSSTGGPEYVWRVQALTRFGWNTLYSFTNEKEAQRICEEWRKTLP